MTQAELARQTGIRPSTINDIYNEMTERLNIEYLDRICEYFVRWFQGTVNILAVNYKHIKDEQE